MYWCGDGADMTIAMALQAGRRTMSRPASGVTGPPPLPYITEHSAWQPPPAAHTSGVEE